MIGPSKSCGVLRVRLRFPFGYRVNDRNVGVNPNFDRAISGCRGEVIFPCDQDDVWLPQKIATMAGALSRYPSSGMVISNSELVDLALRPIGRTLYARRFPSAECLLPGDARVVRLILKEQICFGHTMAFRRLPLIAGPVPKMLGDFGYDVFRAIVAGSLYGVLMLPDVLTKHRRYEGQASSMNGPPPGRLEWLVRCLADIFVHYDAMAARNARIAGNLRTICDELSAVGAHPGAIRFLRGKADIVAFQAQLRPARLRRAVPVLRNLVSGGYHRYGSGLRTAARDLLVPAPRGPRQ